MSDTQALASLGVPGLVAVILVLAGVIVFLYKKIDTLQTRLDSIQERRIIDATETRDKLTEPLERQAVMSEKIYDILLSKGR